jgi:methyl-accepting chemotaxis protein
MARCAKAASWSVQAGESLTEIVSAVKKVTDIVSEIAAASREQATGSGAGQHRRVAAWTR